MSKKKQICTDCGATGKPVFHTPGSILVELILWLCFIIPGLIYSIWRHNKRSLVCASCGSEHLIPLDTPKGQKLFREYHGD